MQIIYPSFEILDLESREQGVQMLRRVERLARISHRSEEAQTDVSWERFIKAVVVEKGDWSVTEHVSVTAIARVNRGVTHEVVRHRIGSYTQESTRFCNYGKNGKSTLEFIPSVGVKPEDLFNWCFDLETIEGIYLRWLAKGYPPEVARDFLPNALASTIAFTYNLRTWRHIFMMRTTINTHRDFRETTLPLLKIFKERIPLLYDDLEPSQQQNISLARPR
jgi:thymidylate synthase (FAD)